MDGDRKVSLPQFVLHDHSVLGLCFAREAPPPVGVGCCCVCSDGLSVRHRLFVLSLSVCATLLLSVYVSLGLRSSGSALLLTVCFVAPVVGPFDKALFIDSLKSFDLKTAFPDLSSNYHHWRVCPFEPNRVWYSIKYIGANTGPVLGRPATNRQVRVYISDPHVFF